MNKLRPTAINQSKNRAGTEVSGSVDMDAFVGRRLADVERDLILSTLSRCGGNRAWAADILGICVRALRNKLLRYRESGLIEITPADEAAAEEEQQLQILMAYQPGRRLPS